MSQGEKSQGEMSQGEMSLREKCRTILKMMYNITENKYLRHFSLGIFKGVGHVINRLIFSNGIFSYTCNRWIEFPMFRFVRKAIFQFSKGGQEASSISL